MSSRNRRRTRTASVVVVLVVLGLVGGLVGLLQGGPPRSRGRNPETGLGVVALADLPVEARRTVALVQAGGPFPYSEDGATFGNYEGVLPAHARGWYREYTVPTPGERDRGPRRIVTGDRDRQIFYTADHYATFVRVQT